MTHLVYGSQAAAEPEPEVGNLRLVRTASAGERRRRADAPAVARALAAVRG